MERSKNIFDKIGSLIPGYRGYAEREGRRHCDQLLRNQISEEISECESVLQNRIKSEIKAKSFNNLEDLEGCRKKFNTLSSKIKFAPYGESAFFSDSQIKEDELLKIYQLDHNFLGIVNSLKDNLKDMTESEISSNITSLYSSFKERNRFIKEHK